MPSASVTALSLQVLMHISMGETLGKNLACFLQSNSSCAQTANTHHLLLMLSWDLQSNVEELAPLGSGGLISST